MDFVPAGEIIGAAHQVRIVTLANSRCLPDGEYRFLDMYCTDPSCDCRKTIIEVYHNDVLVSVINFGWESRDFYRRWWGCEEDEPFEIQMHGASINITSPDIVSPSAMLDFFNALLDNNWIAKFKAHYAAVKQKLAKIEANKRKRKMPQGDSAQDAEAYAAMSRTTERESKMAEKGIPPEVKRQVEELVESFNRKKLFKWDREYAVRFHGRFAYLDRDDGFGFHPICRLEYGGSMSNWKFAIYKYSSERYDPDEHWFPGFTLLDGTVEGAMQAGLEAYE